jgi:DNA replication protein DnaC
MEQFKILKSEKGEEYLTPDPIYKKHISKKIYELLLKQSDIPLYYYDVEFKDYKGENSRESVEKIIYYANHFNTEKFNHAHLYLYGENSSQKTALAINVGKEALRKGFKVKFVLAGSLIDKLLKIQGFNYHEELEEEIKKLKENKIIIIDDIFDPAKSLMWNKEQSSNYIVAAWDQFLREILSSKIKIILTSNVPVEAIEAKFGKSMYELIYRNFIALGLFDSIKQYKKKMFDHLFDEIVDKNE